MRVTAGCGALLGGLEQVCCGCWKVALLIFVAERGLSSAVMMLFCAEVLTATCASLERCKVVLELG